MPENQPEITEVPISQPKVALPIVKKVKQKKKIKKKIRRYRPQPKIVEPLVKEMKRAIEEPVEETVPEEEKEIAEERQIDISKLITVKKKLDRGTLKSGSAKDVGFWAMQSMRNAVDKYTKKTFLEKYGTLLSVIFIGLVLSFATVYITNKLVEMTKLVTSAINQATTLANTITTYASQIQTGGVVGKDVAVNR